MTETKKLLVDVVGAAGYTGGELIRLLLIHPHVRLGALVSRSQKGLHAGHVHQDLLHQNDLVFSEDPSPAPDVTFLCMGHGKSREWVEKNQPSGKIIDLSQDFRLSDTAGEFIYGLPEFQRDRIRNAKYIANPGCFATAIQLALLPLASAGLINDEVHIHGTTGSTGAGQSLSPTSHFSWRNNNMSLYKTFEHQHLHEISETLGKLQPDLPDLLFLPARGNFTRGIFISAYLRCDQEESTFRDLYHSAYADAPFTHVSPKELHLKQVVNTNNCMVHVTVKKGRVLVTSVIDNLLKGASGQAVQNMNLMFGLNEEDGLHLKSSAF